MKIYIPVLKMFRTSVKDVHNRDRTIRPRTIRPTENSPVDNSPNGQFAHKYCFHVKIYEFICLKKSKKYLHYVQISDGSVVSFQKTAVAVLASVVVFLKTAVAVLMRLC